MKTANIKPLKSCPMCKNENVFATYEENARYRYECGTKMDGAPKERGENNG